jgi:hypothetical protein
MYERTDFLIHIGTSSLYMVLIMKKKKMFILLYLNDIKRILIIENKPKTDQNHYKNKNFKKS